MKVLVIGAAGRTGRAVVEQALAAGHEVTAFVHSAGTDSVPGAAVRTGDATDAQAVSDVVEGQDAVIDTVGGKTPYRHTTLETSIATTIVAAMQRHEVRRLIVTSSIGVGDSMANTPFPVKLVVLTFLRGSTADKTRMEAAVTASGLDWIVTRPATLTDKPATGKVQVISTGSRDQARGITRADLAAFLVAQLTTDENLRKTITLTNS